MRVERVGVDAVKDKLESLKRKMDEAKVCMCLTLTVDAHCISSINCL